MSLFTAVAEIGEGDKIQVRVGTEDLPARMFDAEVSIVTLLEGDSTVHRQVTVPATLAGPVPVLVCRVTNEVPQFVLEQVRNRTPSEPPPKWWRWSGRSLPQLRRMP